MENIIKNYRNRLYTLSFVGAILISLFVYWIVGIISLIIFLLLSKHYIKIKEEDKEFINNLKNPKRTKKKVGMYGMRFFLILLLAIFGGFTYQSIPEINYKLAGITTVIIILIILTFLKKN